LSNGEIAIETNTKKLKVGDGSTAWNNLKYVCVDGGDIDINISGNATAAATLYFDGAVDGAWTTAGNWWLDDEHTEPAGRLPTSADSVVVTNATITASGQTVVDFTLDDPSEGDFFSLSGTLTVTGVATFNGEAGIGNSGTVTGNATFNDGSYNSGTVTGNATFNNNASNFGTVTGTATFNDSACNFAGGTAGTFVPDPPPACGVQPEDPTP
jgi:hypothetical protein